MLCNTATSILCGLVVFSSLSQLASEMDVDMKDLFNKQHQPGGVGAEVVFIAYPALLSHVGNSVWSVLFFLMMLSLGIDSLVSNEY